MSIALRLYSDDSCDDSCELPVVAASPPPPAISLGPTLREVWEQLKLPELQQEGRAAETLADYVRHIDRWEVFHRSTGLEKYRMSNPALGQISRASLLAWRAWLVAQPAIGPRSANKHLGTIHALLACAESHGLMNTTPRLPPLAHRAAAPKLYLSHDEIDAIYRACETADWPHRDGLGRPLGVPAARSWQSLLVLLFNFGFRTQELVAYERSATPIRWRQIHRSPETPAIDGRAVCPWGWLAYLPAKQSRFKAAPLILPLNETTSRHLRSIEPADSLDPARPIFDWPLSPDAFYATWQAILDASGVHPKSDPVTGEAAKYQLKHFRKTAITWLNNHRPGIAPHVTGHAARGRDDTVSSRHYDNVELAVLEALRTLPQPMSFAAPVGTEQRLLF